MRTTGDIAEMYDRQAGTYLAAMANVSYANLKAQVGKKLAGIIETFEPDNLLDAGVGEATTLVALLKAMEKKPKRVVGFDASLKRLDLARKHLRDNGLTGLMLQSSLEAIPLGESSFDVVMTFHAIESNRGKEKAIIQELYRVAKKALVMVEPCYEIATQEQKARMDRLGYCVGLYDTCCSLGYHVSCEPWDLDANPDNPAGLIVVEK